ncbi:MAG: hypothetical protein JWQ53_2654 [Klenkia sp.]|nr:hypothetical protein [Klenkia sp.]
MSSLTTPPAHVPVSAVPPFTAWLAAVAGFLGALPVAFFAVFVGLLAVGYEDWRGGLLGAIPAVAFVLVLVGVVLLLLGRSWSVLVAGALVTVGLVVAALATGAMTDDWGSVVWLGGGPLLAVVLGSLPNVRAWVTARRASRR